MNPGAGFSEEQKQYLAGFMAGAMQRGSLPFVGTTPGGLITHDPASAGANEAAEKTVFGTPVEDLCREEVIKLEQNPLDIWERLIAHAEADKFPDDADKFRFKYHGLFHVAPAQNSFMIRLRVPACVLTSAQLRGLAQLASDWGAGHADITTRGNIQIRELPPRSIVNVLTRLVELGLTSRGAGADNIRNVTASPTSGFDPFEVLDVRKHALAMHHYILNNRDMYGLPRKFNIAFDSGGSISVAEDTNDIGFVAVNVAEGKSVPAGIYFRVNLGGITGHKDIAKDTGLLVKPEEAVAVAAAMVRVFTENGDRTNRKKARLKYVLEKWGVEKFLEETGKKLAFPLRKVPLSECEPRRPVIRHGHIGAYSQSQSGLNYVGVVIPVGRMKARQMIQLAEVAEQYGSGEVRLTVFQNMIIPNIRNDDLDTVKDKLVFIGFHHQASSVCGGLVACTGSKGCKFAQADTKGNAITLGNYLDSRLTLDRPINIHLTGCPHSCAQHYVGDIGLMGVKVNGEDGYNVVLGGGMDHEAGIAKEVFWNVTFSEVPPLLERVLKLYQSKRNPGETFIEFTRRHQVKELQDALAEIPA